MLYENVDLHGIAEAVAVRGEPGLRLQRVPETVRAQLEEPARNKTLNPAGAEVRFVPLEGSVRITLSSSEETGTARLFHGPFDSRLAWTFGREPVTLEIGGMDPLWRTRFDSLPPEQADGLPFHPRVCRLVLRHGVVRLHGIEGAARPPARSELPDLTMIAYGTSITHGAAATAFHLSYIAQTAWRLGCDLINLGVGGACLAEPAFGDYIAERTDWDLAVLSLSVNMVSRGYTPQEFRRRVGYVVGRVATAHPQKPVACISLYPFYQDWAKLNPDVKAHPDVFRRQLQEVVQETEGNLHFIPGPELLTDIGGLTVDMLHPSDLGMIQIGQNLAARLAPIADELRTGRRQPASA